MMWTELTDLSAAPPIELNWKKTVLSSSEYIWLVQRDDETPVMLAGLFRPSLWLADRLIWVIPYPTIRPIDLRGLRKLFAKIVAGIPNIVAEVDVTDKKAVALAKHIGLRLDHMKSPTEGIFRWV
jgi:hypothetical protein